MDTTIDQGDSQGIQEIQGSQGKKRQLDNEDTVFFVVEEKKDPKRLQLDTEHGKNTSIETGLGIPVVVNDCFGGFSFSSEYKKLLIARGVADNAETISRTNKELVQLVQEGHTDASSCCVLRIEYVNPEYINFIEIIDCEGIEGVKIDEGRFQEWKEKQNKKTLQTEAAKILSNSALTEQEIIAMMKQLFLSQ